jgi:hypothetical protein
VKLIFNLISDWLKKVYVEPILKMIKVQLAIGFLEGIRAARRILLLLVLLVFVITLIGGGLVLIPLSLLLFMDWAPHTKAIVGMVVGLLYLVVPAVALLPLLSEKRWMRVTSASKVLRQLTD